MTKSRMQQEFEQKENREEVRLNKYLSESGICSRREADRLIEAGRVSVNGRTAQTGMKVSSKDHVLVDGSPCVRENEMILLAVNKPVGVVCTTDKRWGDQTVEEMLDYPKRVFSIGRLDKNSEGLLLMTNNGDILNKIMRAGNYHERMAMGGIPVLNQMTRPCKVEKTGRSTFRIILTQGLNRQIRRMCEYCGCKVLRLRRVRIMNIFLGDLKPGEYRQVTGQEMEILYDLLKGSKNGPTGK